MFEEREISGVFFTLFYLNFHLCNTFNKNVRNGEYFKYDIPHFTQNTLTFFSVY